MRSPRSAASTGLKLDDRAQARLERLAAAITSEAAPRPDQFLESIKAGKDNSWVDGFLAFRYEFEFADVGCRRHGRIQRPAIEARTPAAKLLGEARGLFQQGRRDDGLAKAKEIVDKYYASSSYRLASKWLDGRK